MSHRPITAADNGGTSLSQFWGGFAIEDAQVPGRANCVFNDFLNFSETNNGGLFIYDDTGNTAGLLATEEHGVLRLALDNTDNDQSVLTTGGNAAGMVAISTTTKKRVWFEARVRINQITDQGIFIGLTEEGLAADNTLVDNTGALADKDMIGFHVPTADPDGVDAVYREAGQTAVTVDTDVQVLTAATWYKFGLHFDGEKVHWYINGVEVASQSVAAATNFPEGEELAALLTIKNGDGTARTMDIDWIAFACDR